MLEENRKLEDVKQLEASSAKAISEHLNFLHGKASKNPIIFSFGRPDEINRALLADILLKKRIKGKLLSEIDYKKNAIMICEKILADIPKREHDQKQEYDNDIEYIVTIFNHALRKIEFDIDMKILLTFTSYAYYEIVKINEVLIKKSDIFEEIFFFLTNILQNFIPFNQFYEVITIIGQIKSDFTVYEFNLPKKKTSNWPGRSSFDGQMDWPNINQIFSFKHGANIHEENSESGLMQLKFAKDDKFIHYQSHPPFDGASKIYGNHSEDIKQLARMVETFQELADKEIKSFKSDIKTYRRQSDTTQIDSESKENDSGDGDINKSLHSKYLQQATMKTLTEKLVFANIINIT